MQICFSGHILTYHHGWVITCPVDQCKGIYNHEPSLKRHIRGNHGTVIERLMEELFQQMPTNRPSIPVSNNDTALGVPSSFCTRCRSEIKANGDNYRQSEFLDLASPSTITRNSQTTLSINTLEYGFLAQAMDARNSILGSAICGGM